MADLYAECDWDGGTLSLFLPEIPDEILVRRTDVRNRSVYSAHVHRYVPERRARKVTVWNHDTDHATGHTECSECGARMFGELPVAIAHQQNWPLAEGISAVTVADRDGMKMWLAASPSYDLDYAPRNAWEGGIEGIDWEDEEW